MRLIVARCVLLLVVIKVTGCRYPFEADLESGDVSRLVVDGYIDVTPNAITYFTLSRTTPLSDKILFLPEQGATVSIEAQSGEIYPLAESGPGKYQSPSLNLDPADQFRLVIVSNGTTYNSEFMIPVITPGIDSVTWIQHDDGVRIHISTHASNENLYFMWNYQEVWERISPVYSLWKYEKGKFVHRSAQEIKDMKTCWVYENGSDINIEASEKYSSGSVPPTLLKYIVKSDERLFVRYSILVKQHCLTREAFRYYQLLKKIGSMGTFSDPLPVELPSNIRSIESTDRVVGWIGAYTTQQTRLEIDESEITNWKISISCKEEKFSLHDFAVFKDAYLPTKPDQDFENMEPDSALAVAAYCADCRLNNGTNIKPDFWE